MINIEEIRKNPDNQNWYEISYNEVKEICKVFI